MTTCGLLERAIACFIISIMETFTATQHLPPHNINMHNITYCYNICTCSSDNNLYPYMDMFTKGSKLITNLIGQFPNNNTCTCNNNNNQSLQIKIN